MNQIELLKKELEQTKLAYQMTAQINQFKSSFLAKTAHELRSPLSSLMGLHQLILADLCENPEEEKEFIQQGYQAAQKLIEMMDRIVTISKLDYGTTPLSIETLSLNQTLTEIYHLTQLQAANHSLRIKLNLSETDGDIKTDQSHLIQTITILVDTGISLQKKGDLILSSKLNLLENFGEILIDMSCNLEDWQQEKPTLEASQLNLIAVKQWNDTLGISPSLKLLLAQTLLEKMGGKLQLIDLFADNHSKPFMRVQCLMPLVNSQ